MVVVVLCLDLIGTTFLGSSPKRDWHKSEAGTIERSAASTSRGRSIGNSDGSPSSLVEGVLKRDVLERTSRRGVDRLRPARPDGPSSRTMIEAGRKACEVDHPRQLELKLDDRLSPDPEHPPPEEPADVDRPEQGVELGGVRKAR